MIQLQPRSFGIYVSGCSGMRSSVVCQYKQRFSMDLQLFIISNKTSMFMMLSLNEVDTSNLLSKVEEVQWKYSFNCCSITLCSTHHR